MNLRKIFTRLSISVVICLIWYLTNSLLFTKLAWEYSVIFKPLSSAVFILALIFIYFWLTGKALYSNPVFFLLFFTICFFIVRLPFYVKPFEGEDTVLAEIFINHPEGPFYWIMGQVNGVKYYNVTYHPGMSYALLELSGSLAQYFMDFKNFNTLETATRLRFIFSLYQYFFFAALIGLIGLVIRKNEQWKEKAGLLFGFILIISISPLAINNSTDLQIDSTSGILVSGIFFLCLMGSQFILMPPKYQYTLLFIGSAFTGFGKNEWALMFFAAVTVYYLVEQFRKKILHADIPLRQINHITLITYGGSILGNTINYLYDPINYIGGFKLLSAMALHFSLQRSESKEVIIHNESAFNITMSNSASNWIKITLERLEYIFPLLILLIVMSYLFIKNYKQINTWLSLSFIYSGALFMSFFISSWGTFLRYFAPSLIGIVVTACIFLLDSPLKIKLWVKIAFASVCLLAMLRLYSLEISLRGRATNVFFESNIQKEQNMKTGCINGVNVSVNKPPGTDYFIKYYGLKSLDTLHLDLHECAQDHE